MADSDGLISAYRLDGNGRGEALDWAGVGAWKPGDGVLWVHLDRSVKEVLDWLGNESGLDPLVVDALLAEDTRPRSAFFGDGVLVNLRGVNLNPDAVPEDMVSVRVWMEPERIISTRRRTLQAIQDIRDDLAVLFVSRMLHKYLIAKEDAVASTTYFSDYLRALKLPEMALPEFAARTVAPALLKNESRLPAEVRFELRNLQASGA